jgi:hypothetical protein
VVATAECSVAGNECVYVRSERTIPERGDSEAIPCLEAALEGLIDPPYRAVGFRREDSVWAVGAVRIEVAELAADQEGEEIVLTVSEGEAELLVDGRPSVAGVDALTQLAAGRHESYVLRAERLEGRLWELAIDPL